jgi:cytochrome c oxidase assembly factor CtaG
MAVTSSSAVAHDLNGAGQGMPGWTWDPWIVVPLLITAACFMAGWRRLRARSSLGRNALERRSVLFGCGWFVLVASLMSPLHEAGERSFAAHMFEHELLMLLAAPLLVLSEPLAIMLWAFPTGVRRLIGGMTRSSPVSVAWRRLTAPVTATLIQAAVLWGWHAPMLFDLALSNDGWHVVQHLSFLISALLFWTAMIGPRGAGSSASSARALSALCLFATSVVSGALGALMAFSQSPWYLGYAKLGMAPFGLTPAEDQQLAGLIMWIPGGLVHAGAALVLVTTMLKPPVPTKAANAL